MKDYKFRIWDKELKQMITEDNVENIVNNINNNINQYEIWTDKYRDYNEDEWYPACDIKTFKYFQDFIESGKDRYEIMQFTRII